MNVVQVFDLNKLVEFSQKQGLLNSMEARRPVKKDLLKTSNFNVVLICLETGQEIPSRSEPYGVCFYVIKGKGVFTVGSEQVKLSSGGLIFAPADEHEEY